jgi:hypothetical protein
MGIIEVYGDVHAIHLSHPLRAEMIDRFRAVAPAPYLARRSHALPAVFVLLVSASNGSD